MLFFGILLIVFATVSFAFKNEGVRGAGRVVHGVGLASIGVALTGFGLPTHWACGGYVLIACGFATSLFGARKFLRRKLVQ